MQSHTVHGRNPASHTARPAIPGLYHKKHDQHLVIISNNNMLGLPGGFARNFNIFWGGVGWG